MNWDPDPYIFTIPFIERPIAWYGLCFVVGFMVGYQILIRRLPYPRGEARAFVDSLLWYIIVGMIVGARLGEVFFYSWPHFREHPWDIIKVWEGGLASHVGAVGVIVAVALFVQQKKSVYPDMQLVKLLDYIVMPTAFVAGCIRIGNFINQEIAGIPSNVPWAVTFLHPFDGGAPVPRHPVQLYEALWYFGVFVYLYKRKETRGQTGLFFMLVFGFRIFAEVFKVPQSEIIGPETWLSMGQILSIPFVLLGIVLYRRARA